MEAACRGARESPAYRDGDTVALVPGHLGSTANAYSDIVLPTGLDHARNVLVAHADALVANAPLDDRRFDTIPDDRVFGVETARDAVAVLHERVDAYLGASDCGS